MAHAKRYKRIIIFPWFYKLLLTIYFRLFGNRRANFYFTPERRIMGLVHFFQICFPRIKKKFAFTPVMKYFRLYFLMIVEPDILNFIITVILSQWYMRENGNYLYPVAFRSYRLSPVECNYGVGDLELLIIVDTFRDWRLILYGT